MPYKHQVGGSNPSPSTRLQSDGNIGSHVYRTIPASAQVPDIQVTRTEGSQFFNLCWRGPHFFTLSHAST